MLSQSKNDKDRYFLSFIRSMFRFTEREIGNIAASAYLRINPGAKKEIAIK